MEITDMNTDDGMSTHEQYYWKITQMNLELLLSTYSFTYVAFLLRTPYSIIYGRDSITESD